MTLRIFLSVFSVLAALIGCLHRPVKETTKPNWLAPLDSKAWVEQNAGKPYSLTSGSFEGRDSLRFEIRQWETWESGDFRTF